MTPRAAVVVALCCLPLGACSTLGPAERAPSGADATPAQPAEFEVAPQRYVVLTLTNRVPAPAGRATATPRGYDLVRPYRASGAARSTRDALARDFGLRAAAEWPIRALGVHCIVYRLPDGAERTATIAALARDPRVESVQPLAEFTTLAEPRGDARPEAARDPLRGGPREALRAEASAGDPYRALQSNLDALGVEAAHRVSRGRGVRIAIVDSAVDVRHPDLEARRISMQDFVGRAPAPDAHGTQVAGVIAAIPGNGVGIVGIAPDAQVLALRACWTPATAGAADVCNSFTLAQALGAAVDARADVINLSLSGPRDALLERLVGVAVRRGTVVVAAAPARGGASFPTTVAGVLAVEAAGTMAESASDRVGAPGADVLTLMPGGTFDFASGSSIAAAQVSAVAALLLAARPGLDPDAVRTALLASAPRPASTARATASINACRALALADVAVDCADTPQLALRAVAAAGHSPPR